MYIHKRKKWWWLSPIGGIFWEQFCSNQNTTLVTHFFALNFACVWCMREIIMSDVQRPTTLNKMACLQNSINKFYDRDSEKLFLIFMRFKSNFSLVLLVFIVKAKFWPDFHMIFFSRSRCTFLYWLSCLKFLP